MLVTSMESLDKTRVIIHWDYENRGIRKGVDCEFVCNSIRTKLLDEGYVIKDVNVYMRCNEVSTDPARAKEKDLVTRFNHMAFNVVNCSSTKKTNEIVDKKIMGALWNCLDESNTTVAVITRDNDYCETLNKLRNRGIKTLVIGDEAEESPIPHSLMFSADKIILLPFKPSDDHALSSTPPPSSSSSFSLTKWGKTILKIIETTDGAKDDDQNTKLKSTVADHFYRQCRDTQTRKELFRKTLDELQAQKMITFTTQHITLLPPKSK